MTLAKAGSSIAIIPYIAIIVITIVFPIHSPGEVGDETTYYVYRTVTIYLKDSGPTIYTYMNYSSGPGSLLIDLPVEPVEDSIEVVYGNATLAMYIGYLYALILTNSSRGYIILRYSGVYRIDSEGLKSIGIRNVSRASYIDLIANNKVEIREPPPNALEIEEGNYIKYRIYNLEGVISIQMSSQRNNADLELIGLLASISIIGMAATYYAISAQKRRSSTIDKIDALDREILRVIERIGKGDASVSRIQELTGLPKTTLWRRLRKLVRLGYIEIYRVGRKSIIRAKRSRI